MGIRIAKVVVPFNPPRREELKERIQGSSPRIAQEDGGGMKVIPKETKDASSQDDGGQGYPDILIEEGNPKQGDADDERSSCSQSI
jgi:hypothetical protein